MHEASTNLHEAGLLDQRVLVVAPTPRDGQVTALILANVKIDCTVCITLEKACNQLAYGAAALLISEEQLSSAASELLANILSNQPVWSDLPIIVLARDDEESTIVDLAIRTLGNVTVVERPLRISTLLSLVRSAIRARQRQYQVRDHLAQRQREEQELREAREQAEAANTAKDRFLAVLSHELRTPLSPVLMTVTAMEEDPELPEQFRSYMAMVRRNVELETKLIDDLLDISRVINGKLRLRVEPLKLNELLDQVIAVCTSDISAKRLSVVFEERATEDCVCGDAGRLQQVFWNLLKNAVKFSPADHPIVIKTINQDDRKIQVRIKDQGIGIPTEMLPRLFNAFEQGDPKITHRFGGLGLGLAISKALIDLHAGSITATSAGSEQGSEFIVELNLAHTSTTQHPAPSGRCATALSRTRLLLVEDHPDTSRVLARLLRGLGYEVTSAASVAEAVLLADHQPFDVLLSDIGLPDGTGYDLMQQLRTHHDIPGIALSGYGMEDDLRRSRESGFADHIVKPVNISQLDTIIRRTRQQQLQSQS